jgi:hypothetical protein
MDRVRGRELRFSFDACRTELYFDPIFIHRLGNHWAVSTNSTTRCHSTSLAISDHAVFFHNNVQVLPPVALVTVPPNTTLICDSFSIPSLPVTSNKSLVILDSTILNASSADFYDLHVFLSNSTRWRKLPYIPDHFKSVLDFLANSPPSSQYITAGSWHLSPFSYVTIVLLLLVFILLSILLYGRYVKKPHPPTVHLELPTIS